MFHNDTQLNRVLGHACSSYYPCITHYRTRGARGVAAGDLGPRGHTSELASARAAALLGRCMSEMRMCTTGPMRALSM